jgi:IS1 family transposase
MNTLSNDLKTTAIQALIEGNSIRSTERMTGIHRDTIMRLLVRTGDECQRFMNDRIKNVQSQKVQVDEIWTYVFKKQARISGDENAAGIGDQYVFVGIDSDTKLVISHLVGKRDAASCYYFMRDLKDRLATRVQLTTDGFKPYINAVDDTFGTTVLIDGGAGEIIFTWRGSVTATSLKSLIKNPRQSTNNTTRVGRATITSYNFGCLSFTTSARPYESKYSTEAM